MKNKRTITEHKYMIKQLKKQLLKDFGEKCRDFVYGCPVCMVWLAFAILEERFDRFWRNDVLRDEVHSKECCSLSTKGISCICSCHKKTVKTFIRNLFHLQVQKFREMLKDEKIIYSDGYDAGKPYTGKMEKELRNDFRASLRSQLKKLEEEI